jgi:hypothetical protein
VDNSNRRAKPAQLLSRLSRFGRYPNRVRRGLDHPLTVWKLADPEINVVVNGDLALA